MYTLNIRISNYLKETIKTRENFLNIYKDMIRALELGEIRVAKKINNKWSLNSDIKEMFLLAFKFGKLIKVDGIYGHFYDKDTINLRILSRKNKIRMVPGGSSIRCGSYIADGTIIMPPSYINLGTYIDTGCLIDSHVLVGSCAQIGKNVHLSAAVQIGGVLEPVGSMPVIIEDNVFIGGNCGIYEGTILKEGSVLGTGTIINSSIPVFDNVNGIYIKKNEDDGVLTIPENAVVIPGSRPLKNTYHKESNIHIYCPIIVKYRDFKTSKSISLEDILR